MRLAKRLGISPWYLPHGAPARILAQQRQCFGREKTRQGMKIIAIVDGQSQFQRARLLRRRYSAANKSRVASQIRAAKAQVKIV